MEKTITFILEQQAELTVKLSSLSDKVDRNTNSITALLAIAEIQAAEIRDLSQSTKELRESTRELRETTQTLGDRQREAEERGRQTDERLNVLINIVERHISEGRNGKT